MAEQTEQVMYEHIVKTPGVMGGRPRIAGRRIRVEDIYVAQTFHGWDAEETCRQYSLTLGEVHAALAYAYDHLDEILASIEQQQAEYERLKAESPPSKLQQTLEARQRE